jgi:MFS family permease
LRTPYVRSMLGLSVLARMPLGINALAIVLLVRHEGGSYALAGAAAGAMAIGVGGSSPFIGRLIDRRGQREVLAPLAIAHAVALAIIVAVTLAHAPGGVIVAASLAGGIAFPPIGSVMRPLWPRLLSDRPELLTTAFALDSAIVELAFVAGPLLTAGIVAVASPAPALAVSAVSSVVGTLWLTSMPPSRSFQPTPRDSSHHFLGALMSPGVRMLVLTTLPLGFCFGAVEVTFPAFCEDVASRGQAGLLLAAWSLGSAAGGIAYGAVHWTLPAWRRYPRCAVALPLGFLPLAIPGSVGLMLPLAFLSGVTIAPLLSTGNQVVGEIAAEGTVTEAYTWPITALVVGISAGNAAAGVIAGSAGWRESFLIASGAAALGAVVAVAQRHRLVPPAAA